jgi:hypothetical protein
MPISMVAESHPVPNAVWLLCRWVYPGQHPSRA